MSVENWDEFRTAYQVAKQGTVSGAAQTLGVHHATVIRHIDALEARIGAKLFQRHPRGYTPTEAGQDLFAVAQATDDQFAQLVSRIKGTGSEISGELVITTVPGVSKFLVPTLIEFKRRHPGLIVRHLSDTRIYRLEYGEAHVAIRAGQPPQEPDNVVQKFYAQDVGLYAHKDYVAQFEATADSPLIDQVDFVATDDTKVRAPFHRWLFENVDTARIGFRASDTESLNTALLGGGGAGFMIVREAELYPDLVQVAPPQEEWQAKTWLVTHVDLHRTPKVQAFLTFLKEKSKEWEAEE